MTNRRVMTFFPQLFSVDEITGHQNVGLDVIDSLFVSGQKYKLSSGRRNQLTSLKGRMLPTTLGLG